MRLHAQRLMASCAVACAALLFGGGEAGGLHTALGVTSDSQSNETKPLRLGPALGNGHRSVRANLSRRRTVAPSKLARRHPGRRQRATPSSPTNVSNLGEAERQLFGLTQGWSRSRDNSLPGPISVRRTSVRSSGLPLFSSFEPRTPQRVHSDDLRGLTLPNLPVRLEERTLRYLRFYRDSARGRRAARAWARQSGRYTPLIVAALAKAGLPTDLVWMSLIESGHNPTIRSPAGAAGLWQFMPDSARAYGLKVSRWVDERLDPMRSTDAAIKYLTQLKRRFGTWELAMAAYNMGHYGLNRVIRKYNTNDFWRLARLEAALPWETTLYVPKVLAVATLMNNRKAFGLAELERKAAIGFEVVYVSPGISLATIAQYAGVSLTKLRSLNPQFLARVTPPSAHSKRRPSWAVYVPSGRGSSVRQKLASLAGNAPLPIVTVRQGDTVSTIAARLGAKESRLSRLNHLRRGEVLAAGSVLLAPEASSNRLPSAAKERESHVVISRPAFRYKDRSRVFYRATSGDQLSTVAEAFRISPEDLRLWNDLDPRAVLQSGMVLQVFVSAEAILPNLRFTREANAGKQLRVGSDEFFSHFESEKGRRRLQIQSRAGDTLYSIGKRYGLSGGMMARINHRPQRERLIPGSPVVVYARYGPIAYEVLLSQAPSPLPPAVPPHPASLPLAPHSQLTPH